MKYAIVNTTLVMTDHLIPNGAIIVEDGRIAQQGRHEDLIQQEGLYQRVYRIQAALEDELNSEIA